MKWRRLVDKEANALNMSWIDLERYPRIEREGINDGRTL